MRHVTVSPRLNCPTWAFSKTLLAFSCSPSNCSHISWMNNVNPVSPVKVPILQSQFEAIDSYPKKMSSSTDIKTMHISYGISIPLQHIHNVVLPCPSIHECVMGLVYAPLQNGQVPVFCLNPFYRIQMLQYILIVRHGVRQTTRVQVPYLIRPSVWSDYVYKS